jgi:DnaJ-class molecular chaperone
MDEDAYDYCDECGGYLEFEDCPECGGEGFVEHMGDAEEPWDSLDDCEMCDGVGGWLFCRNAEKHPRSAQAAR